MNYILFDPPEIEKFYPFTLTRPLSEMRVFGGTIKKIWERFLGCEVSDLTSSYLSNLYPTNWSDNNILIPSTHLPLIHESVNGKEFSLESVECFKQKPDLIDVHSHSWYKRHFFSDTSPNKLDPPVSIKNQDGVKAYLHNFFGDFPEYIDRDGSLNFYHGEHSISLHSKIQNTIAYHHKLYNREKYFSTSHQYPNLMELKLRFPNVFFNDNEGPIIIENNVIIMEGAMIRGPVHIYEGAVIKMGAKIYGDTIIGPKCKIGGEVSNSFFLGFSNKSHHGFLGNSIIGEWCNIGAGTSNSNLKNDYGFVKMWDYCTRKFQLTHDLEKYDYTQFLGLYMGDHSKCAINTSFNTGTTVGVNCNIFGAGFPRNFIPSFSWGGSQGIKEYDLNKAILVAKEVMKRREVHVENTYIDMLYVVHDITSRYR